jgi:DNA-directed RNA polymerase specialized sigma24 family protein
MGQAGDEAGARSTRARESDLRAEYAKQVNERYLVRLKNFVRATLNSRIRRREGTSDVVQDALKSFFESSAEIDDPDGLWPRLRLFAERKVKNAANKHRAAMRDVGREATVSATAHYDSMDPLMNAIDPASQGAPLEALIIAEELTRLTADEMEIVSMRREGANFNAIGAKLGCDESTVRRKWNRLLARWDAETED